VAYELRPIFDALITDLKRSTKLFMPSRQIAAQSVGLMVTAAAPTSRFSTGRFCKYRQHWVFPIRTSPMTW
jgi:hypothetical protein